MSHKKIQNWDDYHIMKGHKYCTICEGQCALTDEAADHHGHKEKWRDWKTGDSRQ